MRKPNEKRRSAQKPNQKERILRTAAVLFAERGYHDVGVAELADAVELGRGALYYHIKSKEDVLFNISKTYIFELCEEGDRILLSTSDPRERVRLLSRQLVGKIANHLSEMTVCFREIHALSGERRRQVADLHRRYNDIWTTAFNDGVQEGQFRQLPFAGIKGLLGMYFYSFLWLDPKGPMGADEISEIFADIVIRALENKPT